MESSLPWVVGWPLGFLPAVKPCRGSCLSWKLEFALKHIWPFDRYGIWGPRRQMPLSDNYEAMSQSSYVRVRKVFVKLRVQLSGKSMKKLGGSLLSWKEHEVWHHTDLGSSSSWLAYCLCDFGKVIWSPLLHFSIDKKETYFACCWDGLMDQLKGRRQSGHPIKHCNHRVIVLSLYCWYRQSGVGWLEWTEALYSFFLGFQMFPE